MGTWCHKPGYRAGLTSATRISGAARDKKIFLLISNFCIGLAVGLNYNINMETLVIIKRNKLLALEEIQ